MSRAKLMVIVGKVEDFEALGIPTKDEARGLDCRLSNDGTKTFHHVANLTDSEFNNVLVDIMFNQTPFIRMSDENLRAMLEEPEWKVNTEV